MKIQIRPRGITLTKTQCVRLERELDIALVRFGERIDRVIVEISKREVGGLEFCEIELRLKPQILKVEVSDTSVLVAIKHAAQRLARSVSRAIETEQILRH
jgi:ribosome-associated translation inhibitor RaiA